MNRDDIFMGEAFRRALRSLPEDEEIHPKVGALVVKGSDVICGASRNENERGSHAEFLAFKKAKGENIDLSGATLYTTLEPCTHRHGPDLIPCSQRIIDEGIDRVVIGIVDPNPNIEYKGIRLLEESGIETDLGRLRTEIEALNNAFIEKHKKGIEFSLVKGVMENQGSGYPEATRLLEYSLNNAKPSNELKQGGFDFFRELCCYEEFLGLINHLDQGYIDAISRAFLFSLERQKSKVYKSEFPLPLTYHTTEVASCLIGLGSEDPLEIITGQWHDMKEDGFVDKDDVTREVLSYDFSPRDAEGVYESLNLLDRHTYSGKYLEATRDYYLGLREIQSALNAKSADLLKNLKRWLLHKKYLLGYRPYLAGKYFFESTKFMDERGNGVSDEAKYRLGRTRDMISRNLNGEERSTILDATRNKYGKEVEGHVAEIL